MEILDARYQDEAGTVIALTCADGTILSVPAVADNRHYRAILAAEVPIAAFAAPQAGVEAVRAEASLRMQAMFGARDAAHLSIVIENGTREAVRLLRLREDRAWTPEEAQRSLELAGADAAIEAIRAASNVLEAMDPVPADYDDDKYWPGGGGA